MTLCHKVLVNKLFTSVDTNCLGLHVMGYKVRKVVFDLLYSIALVVHEFCGNVPLRVIDQYDVVVISINRSNIVLTP
jgi:hypothetical protein